MAGRKKEENGNIFIDRHVSRIVEETCKPVCSLLILRCSQADAGRKEELKSALSVRFLHSALQR
jgi:hypothetical protein